MNSQELKDASHLLGVIQTSITSESQRIDKINAELSQVGETTVLLAKEMITINEGTTSHHELLDNLSQSTKEVSSQLKHVLSMDEKLDQLIHSHEKRMNAFSTTLTQTINETFHTRNQLDQSIQELYDGYVTKLMEPVDKLSSVSDSVVAMDMEPHIHNIVEYLDTLSNKIIDVETAQEAHASEVETRLGHMTEELTHMIRTVMGLTEQYQKQQDYMEAIQSSLVELATRIDVLTD